MTLAQFLTDHYTSLYVLALILGILYVVVHSDASS